MKTPPFLLGAALLFWGWQTGFVAAGAVMAVVLEGSRWSRVRWEFSEQDFTRIWTFCSLLLLAATVYAFTTNQGPSDFRGFFQNPSLATQRNAGLATARTTAAVLRWLPLLLFLFMASETYSAREGVPLEAISLILRRRWKKARQRGQAVPASRSVNLSYPYFTLCLFAASVHVSEDSGFFWGLCALLGWALWPQRPARFGVVVWAVALGTAIGLGYYGQRSLGQVQRYLGNLNPQWLPGFTHRSFDPAQSRTALGHLGRMKTSAKIVVRLTTESRPAPQLLRAASYREYNRQAWYTRLTASSETPSSDFQVVHEENTNRETYVLQAGRAGPLVANVACYLPGGDGLLPLPAGSARLEHLFAYSLKTNDLGAVLAQGPGLVVFDACYGPGPTIDSPPQEPEDKAVPHGEVSALDHVIEELQWQDQSTAQKLRTLSGFFLDKFRYSTWQEPRRRTGTNETPLGRFLVHDRAGHCEYFATAGVLLLRRAGIPARYAVGYAVHEGAGGKYVVRERDAHSWCLVWNEKARLWQDFDPTPGSWVQTEARRGSRFQALSDGWSWLGFQFAKLRWGQTNLRQYLLWAMVPVLVVLLFQIVFQSRRHRGRRPSGGAVTRPRWPGLDSEFYQLERKLAGQGMGRRADEPLTAWLERGLKEPAWAGVARASQSLLRLHYRYRFDPQGLTPQERETLRREATAWLQKVERLR
ncbi:MAG TPA: transglutaminase-like domain-containing protein [Candidatus Binatia bacterium]|jgi:hypothetical protein|nr:transglutaminase-like domain-containing protein [Candidatus Binatia bacterium]